MKSLLLALALLFVSASAQTEYYEVLTYWDDCNCNGTAYLVEGELLSDQAAFDTCVTNSANDTCICITGGPKRLMIRSGGETLSCRTVAASLNTNGVNTHSGYAIWNQSTCDGHVVYWEEYAIGFCFENGPSSDSPFQVFCNDVDTTGYFSTYSDVNCTAGETNLFNLTACDSTDSSSSLCLQTPAPTDAPTDPPTDAPTDAPTSGTSAVTIADIVIGCKNKVFREASELAFETVVAAATGLPVADVDCSVSKCSANADYTGAQFRYSCKGDFNETTAALICPAIAASFDASLGVDGIASCPADEQGGNPTGTQGLVVAAPLAAAGSFLTTSFFLLVALFLVNYF